MKTSLPLLLAVSTLLLAAPASHGATKDYNGSFDSVAFGSSGFTNATNWDGGVIPANNLTTDIARFNKTSYTGNGSTLLNAGYQLNGLIFGDGSNSTADVTIQINGAAGQQLRLGSGGILMDANSGNATINKLAMPQDLTITNNSTSLLSIGTFGTYNSNSTFTGTLAGSGRITFTGIISDNPTTNAGFTPITVLYISGANVTLGGANTFTGGLILNNGTLWLANNSALGNATNVLTLNGGTIDVTAARTTANNNAQNWNGNFTFGGNNTWDTGTGAVTLDASRTVTVNNSTLTVGGVIGDGGGNYTLTKEGAGALTLNPLLPKNAATTTGSNVTTMTDTTGILIGAYVFGTGIPSGVKVNAISDNASVTLSANATATGNATLNFSTYNNHGGGTVLNAGRLNINSSTALGNGSLTINGGTLANTSTGALALSTNNPITINSGFTFTNIRDLGFGNGSISLGTAAGTSRTITVDNTGIPTLSGPIADGATATQLIKAGTGQLNLEGENSTYSGGVWIKEGVLSLSRDSTASSGNTTAAGTGLITLGASDGGNATLSVGSYTLYNNVTLGSGANGTLSLGVLGATRSGTYRGLIDLNGNDLTLRGAGSTSRVRIAGGITGSGNLTLSNVGSGGIQLDTTAINNAGSITAANTANIVAISADIGPNVTDIVKTNAGTLVLSGNNSYTGNTIVANGTLQCNATCLSDTTDVRLSSNATLNLNFTGNDSVNGLFIDDVPQSNGTWGATGSGAANESALITGTGWLNVTPASPAVSFASWAAGYNVTNSTTANDDSDKFLHGQEYAFDLDPTVKEYGNVLASQTSLSNGNVTLTLAFSGNSAKSDINYVVRRANNPAFTANTVVGFWNGTANWTTSNSTYFANQTQSGNGTVKAINVNMALPAASEPRQFLKVDIE